MPTPVPVSYFPSVAVDAVMEALQAFLTPFIPGGAKQIFRTQINRVPMPPAPCVGLTEILTTQIEVPIMVNNPGTMDGDGSVTITGPLKLDVQLDFYGKDAGDHAAAFVAAFRSAWGYDHFPVTVKPLYTDTGRESPLITGEQQYERHWTVAASLQYNPAVTLPQQSAVELETTTVLAVETYNEG